MKVWLLKQNWHYDEIDCGEYVRAVFSKFPTREELSRCSSKISFGEENSDLYDEESYQNIINGIDGNNEAWESLEEIDTWD